MTRTEEFKVSGEGVLSKIKELINEGNIRRITIKNKEGKVFAEFPLTLGVIGTALLPTLAAIGTVIALATECTIAVEREAHNGTSDEKEEKSSAKSEDTEKNTDGNN